MLLTWLVQVQDKANMFTWTPILTIKGKLLTVSIQVLKRRSRGPRKDE